MNGGGLLMSAISPFKLSWVSFIDLFNLFLLDLLIAYYSLISSTIVLGCTFLVLSVCGVPSSFLFLWGDTFFYCFAYAFPEIFKFLPFLFLRDLLLDTLLLLLYWKTSFLSNTFDLDLIVGFCLLIILRRLAPFLSNFLKVVSLTSSCDYY